MNLHDLKYFAAVAEFRHFGRAAEACNISQPTLSSQIRKLEDELGVSLLERSNKRVDVTPVGRQILDHVRRALSEASLIESVAQAARDPFVGGLRLGVIPTLAPYLLPLILEPMRTSYPKLTIELWEDQTKLLVDGLRNHKLDAALVASPIGTPEFAETILFAEPLIAVLPSSHALTRYKTVDESALAGDLLVMADGHCLANHSLSACGAKKGLQGAMQAATLETLVNLVAAGYGTTLIPALASPGVANRNVELRPLRQKSNRIIRLACRPGFPRPQALRAIEKVIRKAVPKEWLK
ncbi:LysR substrate-binding domain-containing protein [Acidicapsa dinghuensis]|uniref:LysR substrate-binding domain-containing protein n=1 Tax=Acidicapsa dinghuensis TaxID=2218256 RepID=A0ABW1EQF2_9BACT|nr:LysR substrate-binding domain-containing protein [Acidicapsa dinghuensis]